MMPTSIKRRPVLLLSLDDLQLFLLPFLNSSPFAPRYQYVEAHAPSFSAFFGGTRSFGSCLGDVQRGKCSACTGGHEARVSFLISLLIVVNVAYYDSSTVVVNGQFPGPLLTGQINDNFKINVVDQLSDSTMRQSTSIVSDRSRSSSRS